MELEGPGDKSDWTNRDYIISESPDYRSGVVSSSGLHPPPGVKPVLAGVAGGVISTLALHPLDTLKIRCAAGRGTCVKHFRAIRHGPRGLKGFYQGMSPNLTLSALSWGTYFFTYEAAKRRLSSLAGDLSPLCQALAALEAGIVTMILSNPLQVLRTRMVLSAQSCTTTATATTILQREGLGAFVRGFSPNLVGVTHGTIQISLYDHFKKRYKEVVGRDELLSREHVMLAAGSKMVACLATYPCQVVRTVMQDEPQGQAPTARQVVRDLYSGQGLRGFYRGLAPHLLHVTPNVCIIFAVYEADRKSVV